MNKRNWIVLFLVTFSFILGAKAQAFSVNYERVSQIRGNNVSIAISGTEGDRSSLCNLTDFNCSVASTTTINLFKDFGNKDFYLSPDRKFAVVNDSASGVYKYSWYQVGETDITKVKDISFSKPISNLKISGDNTKILFVSKEKNLVIWDIEKNTQINYFPYVGGVSFLAFSNHGNYIAYYKPNTLSDHIKTYTLIDVANSGMYSWDEDNTYWDLLTEEDMAFDFSPDESKFLYLSDFDGYQTIYSVNLKSLTGTEVGRLGKQILKKPAVVSGFVFGDKNNLYFVANRDNPTIWNLYKYNYIEGVVTKISDKVPYWPVPKKTGDYILFYKEGKTPTEVYAYNLKTGKEKRLVVSGVENTSITYGVSKQYGNVWTTVLKPDNFNPKKKYDVVFWLHGGPYRQAAPGYHSYLSYGVYDLGLEQLRQAGFVVVKVDYRGSYGYGRKFASDLIGNVGKKDVDDVMTVFKAVAKEVKMNKAYAMGNSYGGYLALKVLADKPGPAYFDGAISINGVSDWETLLTNIPSSIFTLQFKGAPGNGNNKLYSQASIVSKLANFNSKKVLLVYGENDDTVPVAQSQDFYEKLWEQIGDDVTILQLPNEQHVIHGKANLDDFYKEVKSFLGV